MAAEATIAPLSAVQGSHVTCLLAADQGQNFTDIYRAIQEDSNNTNGTRFI